LSGINNNNQVNRIQGTCLVDVVLVFVCPSESRKEKMSRFHAKKSVVVVKQEEEHLLSAV